MSGTSLRRDNWSEIAVRFDRAVRELKGAQQHKCEAVVEFLCAREALRARLDAAIEQGCHGERPATGDETA